MILLKQEAKQIESQSYDTRVEEIYESRALSSGADIDPIAQMRANLAQVEDLIGRVRYVMSEVRTIINKRI